MRKHIYDKIVVAVTIILQNCIEYHLGILCKIEQGNCFTIQCSAIFSLIHEITYVKGCLLCTENKY